MMLSVGANLTGATHVAAGPVRVEGRERAGASCTKGKVVQQEVKDDLKQKHRHMNGDCVRPVCPSACLCVCFTD